VAVCIPQHIGEPIVAVGRSSVRRFMDVAGFLDWASGTIGAQFWLTPHSSDWSEMIPTLLNRGVTVSPGKRRGEITMLRVGDRGAQWHGRSASGIVDVSMGMSPGDECAATMAALDEVELELQGPWPGVTLGTSLASTAISCFRQHLRRPIECDWSISSELRRTAYGGGRIECYVRPGSSFSDNALWEIDVHGAYPSAMIGRDIPGEYRGRAAESDYRNPCTMSSALVHVPESIAYPPLRIEERGVIYYPTGTIFGTWSSAELRAAEIVGCQVRAIHTVHAFSPREEFDTFGRTVIAFRSSAAGANARRVAKGLAVQLVGAFGSKPATHRLTCYPRARDSYRSEGVGVYSEERFQPSDREIISAACDIVGTVRAWMAATLFSLQSRNLTALWVHTDGIGVIGGDPVPSIEMASETVGAPTSDRWSVSRLQSLEIWAANQRIATGVDGREKITAGGISRDLSAEEIRGQLRRARETAASTEWMAAKRNFSGGISIPISYASINCHRAAEISKLEQLTRSGDRCDSSAL